MYNDCMTTTWNLIVPSATYTLTTTDQSIISYDAFEILIKNCDQTDLEYIGNFENFIDYFTSCATRN